MQLAKPYRNDRGFLVVEDEQYVMEKDRAHRTLPAPMAGITAKEAGAPAMVLFRMWKIGTRPAGGSDLRDANGQLVLQYSVVELPVSEMHNGGVGYAKNEYGDHVYRPDHWTQAGWRLMRDIPSDWREHNARVEEQAKRADIERNANVNTVDAIRMLAEEMRKGRTVDAHVEDAAQADLAGSAPSGDRATAGRAGRRSVGAAGG